MCVFFLTDATHPLGIPVPDGAGPRQLISKILNSSYNSIYKKKKKKTKYHCLAHVWKLLLICVIIFIIVHLCQEKTQNCFFTVLFKVLQRNRISIYISIFIMNIYLKILSCKELAHIITDPEKFQSCRLQAGNLGNSVQVRSLGPPYSLV